MVRLLIDRLGGEAVISAALSLRFPDSPLSPKAVELWGRRGVIPGRWHLPLLALARERGVPLSEEELLSTTSRKEVA